jgi:hypothetical protein
MNEKRGLGVEFRVPPPSPPLEKKKKKKDTRGHLDLLLIGCTLQILIGCAEFLSPIVVITYFGLG